MRQNGEDYYRSSPQPISRNYKNGFKIRKIIPSDRRTAKSERNKHCIMSVTILTFLGHFE